MTQHHDQQGFRHPAAPRPLSTGMHAGIHGRIAIGLGVLGLATCVAPAPWSALALPIVFLACAVALLTEAVFICKDRKVDATLKGTGGHFITIRQEENPVRFYVHVLAYGVLGAFSLLASIGSCLALLIKFAA